MACLASWDLHTQFSIAEVYTFGQPRVGNAAFAAAYQRAVREFRVVHYAGERAQRKLVAQCARVFRRLCRLCLRAVTSCDSKGWCVCHWGLQMSFHTAAPLVGSR